MWPNGTTIGSFGSNSGNYWQQEVPWQNGSMLPHTTPDHQSVISSFPMWNTPIHFSSGTNHIPDFSAPPPNVMIGTSTHNLQLQTNILPPIVPWMTGTMTCPPPPVLILPNTPVNTAGVMREVQPYYIPQPMISNKPSFVNKKQPLDKKDTVKKGEFESKETKKRTKTCLCTNELIKRLLLPPPPPPPPPDIPVVGQIKKLVAIDDKLTAEHNELLKKSKETNCGLGGILNLLRDDTRGCSEPQGDTNVGPQENILSFNKIDCVRSSLETVPHVNIEPLKEQYDYSDINEDNVTSEKAENVANNETDTKFKEFNNKTLNSKVNPISKNKNRRKRNSNRHSGMKEPQNEQTKLIRSNININGDLLEAQFKTPSLESESKLFCRRPVLVLPPVVPATQDWKPNQVVDYSSSSTVQHKSPPKFEPEIFEYRKPVVTHPFKAVDESKQLSNMDKTESESGNEGGYSRRRLIGFF